MVTRREWLRLTAGAGAAMAVTGWTPAWAETMAQQAIITRPIPKTGELLPVVGLGGANTFSAAAGREEFATIGEVLQALVDNGGKVFDTAAGYGASEEVAGQVAQERGISSRIWWATKMNVAGGGPAGGGGRADPAAARAQIERSFQRLRIPVIDLIQVHNMGDPATQLPILQEYKEQGRMRYIGITTTNENQYPALERVMREYPIDFIGIDYAVDNRQAEERIFPLAQDLGIATMIYLPFGRSRMWARIGDRPLPEWAAEFDAHTWAQFMIKFVLAHPAVTVVTPGTSNPAHMVDNLGGGRGRLPTPEHVRRMIELVDSLPQA